MLCAHFSSTGVGLTTGEGKVGRQAPGKLTGSCVEGRKEQTHALPSCRGGYVSVPALLHLPYAHAQSGQAQLLHEEWEHMGSEGDTSLVGCLGYGIMVRSSWYFWTFSVRNRDHYRLQPLLTTGCPEPCQHLQGPHIHTPNHRSAPTSHIDNKPQSTS